MTGIRHGVSGTVRRSSFHSKGGFIKVLDTLRAPLPEDTYHNLEQFSLVVGLALRDISTAMVHDDAESVPDWVKASVLGDKHRKHLLNLCLPKIAEQPAARTYGKWFFIILKVTLIE